MVRSCLILTMNFVKHFCWNYFFDKSRYETLNNNIYPITFVSEFLNKRLQKRYSPLSLLGSP